jgi:hypothetical protein
MVFALMALLIAIGVVIIRCSANAIESLNARYRRAIKARAHFPTEQEALKCLSLVWRGGWPDSLHLGDEGHRGARSTGDVMVNAT